MKVLLVRCDADAVTPGQLSIQDSRAKLPINPEVGRRDRIQPGASLRGTDQGSLGLGEDTNGDTDGSAADSRAGDTSARLGLPLRGRQDQDKNAADALEWGPLAMIWHVIYKGQGWPDSVPCSTVARPGDPHGMRTAAAIG